MMDKASILVIEDDHDIREAIVGVLDEITSLKFEVDQSEDGEEALEKILKGSYDLILTDLKLPKLEGDEIIRQVREKNIKTPIIVLSGYLGSSQVREKLVFEDVYLLEKPFESNILIRSIGMLVERLINNKQGAT